MKAIAHHTPEPMLVAYAAGSLGYPFELVVATHVSMCDECRARLSALEAVAGAVLENSATSAVPSSLKAGLMDRLGAPPPPAVPQPRRVGIYPAPLAAVLGDAGPQWRSLGLGVRQSILHEDGTGSVRLLSIPPGQAVPEHGHRGLELTLVLQGSFGDATGSFGVGDLEVADAGLEHVPVAGPGETCICLAATDAPLRFRSVLARLTQRFARI